MDKEIPVEPRGRHSSVPPKPASALRPLNKAGRRARPARALSTEATKHAAAVEQAGKEGLGQYKATAGELKKTLDRILGIKTGIRPRERAVRRPRAIDGGDTHPDAVTIEKEEILSKMREVRDHFCIDFSEKRRATLAINNLDKGCPASINPGDPDFSNPSVMNAVLVVLREARDFAGEIWEAEAYTRLDEKLEAYDGLVAQIMATDAELARQERLAAKKILLRGNEGSPQVGREKLMEWFRRNMLGEIKIENGEEVYHSPETSKYLGKPAEVDEAFELARDVLVTLEIGVSSLYVKRREPFSIVGGNEGDT